MSTKITNQQISQAEREIKKKALNFKKKRRLTKQVRISISLHKKIKAEAKQKKKTISKLLDELLY